MAKTDPAKLNIRLAMQFQPHCEQCNLLIFTSSNIEEDYSRCEICNLTFFCTDNCRSASLSRHRQKRCNQFVEYIESENSRLEMIEETNELVVRMPTEKPRRNYRALSSLKTWKEYFTLGMNPVAALVDENNNPLTQEVYSIRASHLLKAASNASSFILTILAALEAEIPDLEHRSQLTIHMVGATDEELHIQMMNEELLHLLQKLRRLVIGYIGPEWPSKDEGSDQLLNIDSCPECTAAGRIKQIFYSRNLYHKFLERSIQPGRPDLIVAFQTGHAEAETDSWRPTLIKILDMKIPVLFISYNKTEAFEEQLVLQSLGARFKQEPEENRWRGLQPYLDAFEPQDCFYFKNYYWYLVKGRQ